MDNTYHDHYADILCFIYFCPCLGLGLFMAFICDLFFIFNLIFIDINHVTSWKQIHMFLYIFRISLIIFGWQRGWRKWIIFK